MSDEEVWVTLRVAAKTSGVPLRTLYSKVQSGELASRQDAGVTVVLQSAVAALAAARDADDLAANEDAPSAPQSLSDPVDASDPVVHLREEERRLRAERALIEARTAVEQSRQRLAESRAAASSAARDAEERSRMEADSAAATKARAAAEAEAAARAEATRRAAEAARRNREAQQAESRRREEWRQRQLDRAVAWAVEHFHPTLATDAYRTAEAVLGSLPLTENTEIVATILQAAVEKALAPQAERLRREEVTRTWHAIVARLSLAMPSEMAEQMRADFEAQATAMVRRAVAGGGDVTSRLADLVVDLWIYTKAQWRAQYILSRLAAPNANPRDSSRRAVGLPR